MNYQELFFESFSTLVLNKIRTGLAMLGVIIGIASVVALMSLGQSSQKSVETQIKSLGSNLLTVNPGAAEVRGVRGSQVTTLTYEDALAIKNSPQSSAIKSISAEINRNAQLIAGRNNTNTRVIATTPDYFQIRNLTIQYGAVFSDKNLSALSKVIVLGPTTASDLFGQEVNPVGKTVRLDGTSFLVIGVTFAKGGSGFNNQDDQVYIPLTTAQKIIFGQDYVNSISVEAISEKDMDTAQQQINSTLLTRHKINDPARADFSIFSQEDLLGTITQVTGTFTTLLSGIAAISLVVGGIGIMNIMLVTVTERTREIGLRKALGAKKKIITTQFLMEAVIITFLGGLIGILLGISISYLLSTTMNLPFSLDPVSIILAFLVSTGTGLLFGWYPAKKASNLQPIEALRYE